jgi:hypothetical protein
VFCEKRKQNSSEAAQNKNNLKIKHHEKTFTFLSIVAVGNKLRHYRRYQKNGHNSSKPAGVLHGQRFTGRVRCNVV